jgi:hypothetical protein
VSDKIQRVFIIGLPRSGTTWMMWLLAQHPEVVALQQSGMFLPVKRMEEWWCHDHRFSKGRGAGASGNGARYTMAGTASVVRPMDFYEAARSMLDVVFERVAAATPGARVVVDQTPEHVEFVPLIRSIFPDAWFLHVIRDPRAVYASMHKAVSSWADPSGFPDTPVHVARGWTRFLQLGRQVGVTTERYHEVHYEDLKKDAEKELQAIHGWLGLESSPDSRAKAIESCGIEKLRKHTTMPQGFFRRGTSEGWKDDIRRSHLRVIEYLARTEMERQGYECVHPRSHRKPLRLSVYELIQNLINAPARRRVMRRPRHAVSKLGRTLQLMRDFKLVQY